MNDDNYVDASLTRKRVSKLRLRGLSLNTIRVKADIGDYALRPLITGHHQDGSPAVDVGMGTAYRIARLAESTGLGPQLPVFPEQGSSSMVLPFGTIRRLRALAAGGHTRTYLAGRMGLRTGKSVSVLMDPWHNGKVTAKTAVRVHEVYRTLCLFDGPSRRTRNEAARRYWGDYLTWDDDELDRCDVDAFGYIDYDPVAEQEPVSFAAEYVELSGRGWSEDRIADRMGLRVESLQRKKNRHREAISAETARLGS